MTSAAELALREAINCSIRDMLADKPLQEQFARLSTESQAAEAVLAQEIRKEDRYHRVVPLQAAVLAKPDAGAREVARLSQVDLVHVTGSLPSGWLQVSREGKVLGWVHRTLVKEDVASAPAGPAEPVVTTELPAEPAPQPTGPVDYGSYHALVIGINRYGALPRLKTARNDAQAVANVLQQEYGFRVRLLLDATRAAILREMAALRQELGPRDNLLIYYAGHGWLDKEADEGYWLPADATRDNQVNWVPNGTITSSLKAIQAKHVLVVADSCYSGKLTRAVHIRPRTKGYLARIARKRARIVLSSGGLEPVIDSGGGQHSVFAAAFLQALRQNEGVLDGTALFTRIRRPVMVNSDQTPEYADIRKAGHAGGDFLFVRKKRSE